MVYAGNTWDITNATSSETVGNTGVTPLILRLVCFKSTESQNGLPFIINESMSNPNKKYDF